MRARATFLPGKATRSSRAPVRARRESTQCRPQGKRTVKGAAAKATLPDSTRSPGAAAPARRYFVASKAARTASMRLRLTPMSPRPTREAERTWIAFAAGSNQNSTSSTNFISLLVNCAYR